MRRKAVILEGLRDVDSWELAGFPGRVTVASYLTADQHAAQYRLIVDALLDAQEQSLTGVSRDELLAKIRDRIAATTDPAAAERLTHQDSFDLDARMRALHGWGVVARWQDKAKSEADFVRTRDRYQLTSEAADLHRWLRHQIDDDAIATSAAAFAPAVIADRLDETLLALGDADHHRAAQEWAQVRTTLSDMAEAAAIWQSRMAAALAGAPDEDKMRRLRETLLAYVNVWGSGIDTYSPRVREAVQRLQQIPAPAWRAIALAGLDADVADDTIDAVVRVHLGTVQTLAVWFSGPDGQAQRLRRRVRDVVPPLLRGSRALLATGGRVSRRAELLRVAAAVEAAPSDEEAWRTWCAATGLWGARHLPGRPLEPSGSPARTSFWEAPEVLVDVRLRERGARSTVGRPAQVPDRRRARSEAHRLAQAERAQAEAAERRLLARSGLHLADWTPIGHRAEAALAWDLLTAVMRRQPDEGAVRTAYSRDGRFKVVAHAAPVDVPSAVVAMPDGQLACANWRLEMTRT
jgi:uncharacterized protein (TIGR02677 family)